MCIYVLSGKKTKLNHNIDIETYITKQETYIKLDNWNQRYQYSVIGWWELFHIKRRRNVFNHWMMIVYVILTVFYNWHQDMKTTYTASHQSLIYREIWINWLDFFLLLLSKFLGNFKLIFSFCFSRFLYSRVLSRKFSHHNCIYKQAASRQPTKIYRQ